MSNGAQKFLIHAALIVGVGWAGAWSLGSGGGWLIALAFLITFAKVKYD